VASAKDAPCEPVKSATTLPLATASQRLRGRPGRPRTKPSGDNPGDSREPERMQVRAEPGRPAERTQDSPPCAPPGPRLLTRQQAAVYLSLSLDMIDRLTQQGELQRVQLTLGDRTVRKVLYDRADLDRLVELSRSVCRPALRGQFWKWPTPYPQKIGSIAPPGKRFSHKTQISYPLD